jgi:hypothetical protein
VSVQVLGQGGLCGESVGEEAGGDGEAPLEPAQTGKINLL